MIGRLTWLLAVCLVCGLAVSAHAQEGKVVDITLSAGPHPPAGAPDLTVHIPSHYDAQRPLELVVFLHGFDGCSRALVAAAPTPCRRGEPPHRVWDLARQHERAKTNTILLVPQLAYLARNAGGHRFLRPGAFDAMLAELGANERLPVFKDRKVRRVTLVAHSAGYGATAAILRDSQRATSIDNVVLLDALYAGWNVFASWFQQSPAHRLVSLYTAQVGTTTGNRKLIGLLNKAQVHTQIDDGLASTVRSHRLLIAPVRTRHGDMPQAHFADAIAGLADAPFDE